MSIFILLGILSGSFFITVSLVFLLGVFLSLDDKDSSSTIQAFLVFGFSALFGVLILSQTREAIDSQPPTRDIHLTVPKDSSVSTQITSENNTVNISDL